MDNISGTKPAPRPGATVGAETVAIQAQVLEVGDIQKDMVKEKIELDEKGVKGAKPVPDNGLKNYFVRALISIGSNR
jgi:hypothetical protein